jgi:hypothetical protein
MVTVHKVQEDQQFPWGSIPPKEDIINESKPVPIKKHFWHLKVKLFFLQDFCLDLLESMTIIFLSIFGGWSMKYEKNSFALWYFM